MHLHLHLLLKEQTGNLLLLPWSLMKLTSFLIDQASLKSSFVKLFEKIIHVKTQNNRISVATLS